MGAIALRGYYAILDVKEDGRGLATDRAALAALTERTLERAEELLAAGPCCLQLRAKRLAGGALVALGRALGPRARRAGVPLCMNDRLDVALVCRDDVQLVHVGQDDLPLPDLRRVLTGLGPAGAGLSVGVSTHSLAQARAAVEAGADYIGFGPIFPTRSKENPDPVVGVTALREVVSAVDVPVVAIGGITRELVGAVVAAGAAAAAVIGDIENASSRTAAAREVALAFESGQQHA